MRWDILTGEYPPQRGGVSDYARQIANGLAAAGDEVHVWAPACAGCLPSEAGVTVHRLPDHFGSAGRRLLNEGLPADGSSVVLVQYVPHAFGMRGANLAFCFWLWTRRRRYSIWTLFHEVRLSFEFARGPKWNLLAAITWMMAGLVARASGRLYVSTLAWKPLLERFGKTVPELLPVPSNLPIEVDASRVRETRTRLAPDPGTVLIGHFSAYSSLVSPLLTKWLVELLSGDDGRIAMLIGNRAGGYARDLAQRAPSLAKRVHVAEGLDAEDAALYLAACDVIVQPYPDGATTRRTTLMASLALGLPVLTNSGHLTEPVWRESNAVLLVEETAAEMGRILLDGSARKELGRRAAALYRERFSVERVVAKLRADRSAPVHGAESRPNAAA